MRIIRVLLLAGLSVSVTTQLTGCAAAAGAGVAAGATTVTDRRTTGTLIDDQIIEFKVSDAVRSHPDLWNQTHVNATAFNNVVLLTGEAPDDQMKQRVGQLAAGIPKVRQVHNELAVAAPSSVLARSSDTWLTGKVKTSLLTEMKLGGTRVKVVSEQGTVYMMGLVTRAEADQATELARRIGGVQRVVRLFEFID